jgi:hypothetical protein
MQRLTSITEQLKQLTLQAGDPASLSRITRTPQTPASRTQTNLLRRWEIDVNITESANRPRTMSKSTCLHPRRFIEPLHRQRRVHHRHAAA